MYSALFQVAYNTKERKLSLINVESKIIFFFGIEYDFKLANNKRSSIYGSLACH